VLFTAYKRHAETAAVRIFSSGNNDDGSSEQSPTALGDNLKTCKERHIEGVGAGEATGWLYIGVQQHFRIVQTPIISVMNGVFK